MAVHTYEQFFRSLKREGPRPVYYLFGTEEILKDEAIRAIIERVLDPATKDFNLDLVSASQTPPEAVPDICATLPMMSEKRVVIVRQVEAWKRRVKARKAFADSLASPSPETVCVLVQSSTEEKADKALREVAYSVEFREPTPAQTHRWLSREAAERQVKFADGAAEHLIRVVGANLSALSSELEKLAATAETGPATVERIGDLVGIRSGETQYDWRDAIFDDEPARAIDLLEPLLNQAGVNGVRLVMMLGTSLVGVAVARAYYDKKKRTRALEAAIMGSLKAARPFGLPGWQEEAGKWARWAATWPRSRIRHALEQARKADMLLKGTSLSKDRAILTDLVLNLGQPSEVTA